MKSLDLNNRTTRKIILIVAVFFAVLAIITGIFWPDAQFDWFFGSIIYWGGCLLLSIILLIQWTISGGEHRESHLYLTPNGDLDFSTPRTYVSLQKPKVSKFLGAVAWWTTLTLERFEFSNGEVIIQNTKGETISGSLNALTVKRSFTNNNFKKEFYPYKYIISNAEGCKVKFYVNHSVFEINEWDDMHMILEQAGTLTESKVSKFSRKADKILSKLEDFDFSDIPGAVVEVTADTVIKKASGFASSIIKKKLSKKKSKSKWIEKLSIIKDWCLYSILGLYLLVVIVYNLVTFPAWSHPDSDYDEIEISNVLYQQSSSPKDELDNGADNEELFDQLTQDMDLYSCRFNEEGGARMTIALEPETGSGYYRAPSGNIYELTIEEENNTRTSFICSSEKLDGTPSKIVFQINLSEQLTNIEGKMLGTDGETVFTFTGYLAS